MKLIINGDDFGFSPGQNLGILKAHEKGILTSTTAMAAAPYLLEGLALAKGYGDLGIGVHLTLDALAPLSPKEEVPSLVDAKGHFKKHPQHLPIKVHLEEVYVEWKRQIEHLIELGVTPTHLDGHHHLHLHHDLFPVTLALAKEFHLPFRYVETLHGEKEKIALLTSGASYFQGLTDFYKDTVTADYFHHFTKNHPGSSNEIYEIMCHPAYLDDVLFSQSSYQLHRVKELVILTDKEVHESLLSQGITLGNVRDFFNL